MIHICPRSTPVCRAESVESCPRGLAATVRGSFGMSHVHPSPCVRHMYYPALFATFPVDKQRITIVKLSSGAPGTMTTAMEGTSGRVVGGFSDGANTLCRGDWH